MAIKALELYSSTGRLPEGALQAIRDEIERLDPTELIAECIYNIRNSERDRIELSREITRLATQVDKQEDVIKELRDIVRERW